MTDWMSNGEDSIQKDFAGKDAVDMSFDDSAYLTEEEDTSLSQEDISLLEEELSDEDFANLSEEGINDSDSTSDNNGMDTGIQPEIKSREVDQKKIETGKGRGDTSSVFPCTACHKQFALKKYLSKHVKRIHVFQKVKQSISEVMMNKIQSEKNSSQNSGVITCRTCRKVFTVKSSLNRHIRRKHMLQNVKLSTELIQRKAQTKRTSSPVDDVHPCLICQKVFSVKHYLNKHVKRVHLRQSVRSTKIEDSKTQDRKNAGLVVQFFPCTTCFKMFTVKENLDSHVQIVHQNGNLRSKSSSNVAPVSTQVVGNQEDLKAAVATPANNNNNNNNNKIKNNNEKYKDNNNNDSDLRRFFCTVCGRRFSQKAHLTRHNKIHTNEKPFTCFLCYRAFREKSTMQKHVKTVHRNLKAFACAVCDLSFSLKQELDQHVNVNH